MSIRTAIRAVAASLWLACAGTAWAQGPVVLMGIDAEDGGPGGHGPISSYEAVLTNAGGTGILDNVANGGSGILVIGGGKGAFDDVTRFWMQIDTDLGPGLVTFVNGPAAIASQSFAGFAMLAVASDLFNTPGGGMTNAENGALTTREADVAAFVNNGGGLLGFSSAELTLPYGYLGSLGTFTFTGTLGYDDIAPTPAGALIGITNDLDVCCWHDEYTSFPAFLEVLAVNVDTGHPAAIGGVGVFVPPQPPQGPTSHLVWRHQGNGHNVMWVMSSEGVLSSGPLPSMPDVRWKIVASGDFNADGVDDLVWRHQATGRNVIWALGVGDYLDSSPLPRVTNVAWKIVGAGDIDGNGTTDLLWRHQPTGNNKVWLMSGATVADREMLRQVSPGYVLAGTGDFDGDGRADILWRNQAAGRNLLWLMDGTDVALSVQLAVMNPNWRVAGIGDFDGDGRADILWRRRTGQNAIWQMNGPVQAATGALPAQAPSTWRMIGIVDVDDNGSDDIIWRNLADGTNIVWYMGGIAVLDTMWLYSIPGSNWDAVAGSID